MPTSASSVATGARQQVSTDASLSRVGIPARVLLQSCKVRNRSRTFELLAQDSRVGEASRPVDLVLALVDEDAGVSGRYLREPSASWRSRTMQARGSRWNDASAAVATSASRRSGRTRH